MCRSKIYENILITYQRWNLLVETSLCGGDGRFFSRLFLYFWDLIQISSHGYVPKTSGSTQMVTLASEETLHPVHGMIDIHHFCMTRGKKRIFFMATSQRHFFTLFRTSSVFLRTVVHFWPLNQMLMDFLLFKEYFNWWEVDRKRSQLDEIWMYHNPFKMCQ